MLRYIVAAIIAGAAFVCGDAAAQRQIEYNPDYLPALPESNIAHFGYDAVIVMADVDQVSLESEAHMPFTLRQHRISIPIGQIVRSVTLHTYGQLFTSVQPGADLAGAPEGTIAVTISDITPGYDYRQPDERRPARANEFIVLSTPSAELTMRITFSNAEGVLYDTWHPPFAQPREGCAPDALCIGTRVLHTRRRGEPQSGFGNSKEIINRALHEVIQHQLLVASCEFDADTRARASGGRITEEQALVCRYPGYELVSSPNDRD